MKHLALCLLGLCAACASAQTFDPAHLGPAEYKSNFAPNPGASPTSGSRDGWESYPLAEDAGYDPTIDPITFDGASILVKTAAPTHDGPFELGFIKRLHMVSGAGSSVQLRLRMPDAASSTPVRISIFRGSQEELHHAVITGAQWRTLRMSVAASPDTITAIALTAELAHGVQGRQERLFLGDVRLSAMATRRIALSEPAALWDPTRELYYLQHALSTSDELHVRVDASDAEWTLASPDGTINARGKGSDVHHRFTASDASGAWTLHVASKTAETTALLLLRPEKKQGMIFEHPPTLSPDLLASVRTRRDHLRSTAHPEMGVNIARMDAQAVLPGLPSYFAILSQTPELAMLDAIDYRATGDRAALEESRKLLGIVAHWPMWVHPWFPAHGYHSYYPVGMMARHLAVAAEFLGDDLAPADRATLDHSLMELAVKPIYEEYVLEDRLQFNISNWIGNTDGGAMLAALENSDPDAAGYALGLYVKERDHVRAAYTSDGSYGEGVSYQRYDMETTALAAAAAKRVLGQSFDASMMPAERYMRYAAYGADGELDYGDSHIDIRPANVYAYLAALNQSDRLTDFYFKYREQNRGDLLCRVLWEGMILPAKAPPETEPSAVFDRRGIAVLRDNWTADSTVVAMRAGKNFNHNHADQGSLFYAREGKLWLGEAGYADYYKDPAFPTFNTQAVGHNTLLIDGDHESQSLPGNDVFGTAPSFTHSLLGSQASLVQADLTSVYGSKVSRYTRTLFFQANGPLIVIDQVQAAKPHTYTQVWHPKQTVDAIDAGTNSFRLRDEHHDVSVRTFATTGLASKHLDSPMPLASYEKAEHEIVERPTRFEASTTTTQTSAAIVTIIQPDNREAIARATFSHKSGADLLTMDDSGMEFNPNAITAWWTGGALALHTTLFQDRPSGATISATHPIDMRLTRNGGDMQLEIDADQPTELRLEGWTAVGGESVIHLDAGHRKLSLK